MSEPAGLGKLAMQNIPARQLKGRAHGDPVARGNDYGPAASHRLQEMPYLSAIIHQRRGLANPFWRLALSAEHILGYGDGGNIEQNSDERGQSRHPGMIYAAAINEKERGPK